jgi:hypothetical protein
VLWRVCVWGGGGVQDGRGRGQQGGARPLNQLSRQPLYRVGDCGGRGTEKPRCISYAVPVTSISQHVLISCSVLVTTAAVCVRE